LLVLTAYLAASARVAGWLRRRRDVVCPTLDGSGAPAMRSSQRRSAGTADVLIGGLAEPLALYAAARSGSSSAAG
jgi:hypothetical protein